MLTKLLDVFRGTAEARNYGELVVDMHSHILPGIDDGAKDLDDSINLIRSLSKLGFTKLIATPHVMCDYYRNSPEIIQDALKQVRSAVADEGLDISIDAAAEYYVDDGLWDILDSGTALTLGENYLLFELSYMNRPGNIDETIFRIQSAGYTPVLAHPERYPYFFTKKSIREYAELVERGVLLQVNIRSFTGGHSEISQQIARALVNENLVHFLGTDLHQMRQLPDLQKTQMDRWFHKLLDSGNLKNRELIG